MKYAYSADGTLIRKQAFDNNTLGTTTDYIDGFVYVNSTLSYFAMPEGRVLYNGTTFTQEFIITDRQGNARVSFQDNGSGVAVVKQENSYYGFGLALLNSPVGLPTVPNRKLYNGGSEWQNDYSNLPDYYQTFYRNYDAAIGRWIGTDPKAEATASLTVYQYSGNNPIMFNDPLGYLTDGEGYPIQRTGNALNDFNQWEQDMMNIGMKGSGGGGPGRHGFASGEEALDALDKLWTSPRGGYADGTGIYYFPSDRVAVEFGFAQLQSSGLAGSPLLPGSATSLGDAFDNYNSNSNTTADHKLYLTPKLSPEYNNQNRTIGYSGIMLNLVVIPGKGVSEGFFDKALDAMDRGATYTEAIAFAGKNSKLLEFSGEKAFNFVSNTLGFVVIGHDIYQSYKEAQVGNYGQAGWQAFKAVGTGVFMYFGGAEYQGAKLLWGLGTLIIDDSSRH